jgi:hypothetical protein
MERGPSSGWGASEDGPQVSRAHLNSATLQWWEKGAVFLLLPTSPSGRYPLVVLTMAGDLFICAIDLFI